MKELSIKFDRVDYEYLDCIENNIATLLAYEGVQDLRTPFACQWYFFFQEGAKNRVRVKRQAVEDLVLKYTGYRVSQYSLNDKPLDLELYTAHIERKKPLLIIGDAFYMSWLPYFQREHMDHSFIVAGIDEERSVVKVVDAYYNHTEWGLVEPVDTNIPLAELCKITDSLGEGKEYIILEKREGDYAISWNWNGILKENATSIAQNIDRRNMLGQFCEFYRNRLDDIEEIKTFVLDCWLIYRNRKMHSLWLVDSARREDESWHGEIAESFNKEIVTAWQRVNEFAYIMLRRLVRNKKAPETSFDLIENELRASEVKLAMQIIDRTED